MKKILYIEDDYTHFSRMKTWLQSIGYSVIPEKFEDMSNCIDPLFQRESIEDFALRQVSENRKELALILCDIKLLDDTLGGNRVVKKIRSCKEKGLSNIIAMLPIIGITQYPDNRDKIIADGADYVYVKPDSNQSVADFSSDLLRIVIDNQIERFEIRKNQIYPMSLKDEIERFKKDHECEVTAFIMTSFKEKHVKVAKKIQEILSKFGIIGLMASEGEGGKYSDNLWNNIEVYMHGCDFGVGIYADDKVLKGVTEEEQKNNVRINPNMSQEVGYMLALQKPVCILKDYKLKNIPSDLAGKIYVQYKKTDIEEKLTDWLVSKRISER